MDRERLCVRSVRFTRHHCLADVMPAEVPTPHGPLSFVSCAKRPCHCRAANIVRRFAFLRCDASSRWMDLNIASSQLIWAVTRPDTMPFCTAKTVILSYKAVIENKESCAGYRSAVESSEGIPDISWCQGSVWYRHLLLPKESSREGSQRDKHGLALLNG